MFRINRKSALKWMAGLALGVSALSAAAQQGFPSKPVRLITPFPPGGVADALARGIGQQLSERWKHPVVIDNRPGGNTVVAAQELIKQPPDGHTLMLALDMTLVMNQFLYKAPRYDPVKDFTPITRVAEFPFFLITRSEAGAKSVQDYVQRAKREGGKLSVGYPAIVAEITGEILNRAAGVRTSSVQYKGTGDNTLALIRGDLDFIIDTDVTAAQYVQSGRLKVLANSGTRRAANYPDSPTFQEALPGKPEMLIWYGIVAPAGLSGPLTARLADDIAWAMKQAPIQTMLRERSLDAAAAGQDEFRQRIDADARKYGQLIREMKLSFD